MRAWPIIGTGGLRMHRLLLVALLLAVPAVGYADSPGPDTLTPCKGKDAGDACYAAGCSCRESPPGCVDGGGNSCLVCQGASNLTCGEPRGCGGCATAAPAAAALCGFALLWHLGRRRARRRG